MARGKKPTIRLQGPKPSSLGKDLRVSGCPICKRYIFSTQDYVWTKQVGYVHKEECLERVT